MALLAFTRWSLKVPGASFNYASGEDAQFDQKAELVGGTVLGYYVQVVFQMMNYSGAFTDRERGLFGIHFVNTTGGNADPTWTTADFTAVENALLSMWDTLASSISSDFKAIEFRWYAFGPGVNPPNPPARIQPISGSHVGTAAASSAHQLATTATLRTPLRRHWGRIYLPIGTANLNTHGQMSSASTDALANTVRTGLLGAEGSQGITPCVYDRTRKQALGVTAIEVDSVPDIIRRRRPRDTGYRKVITV